ncbi:MAG: SDR family NAD(P)-dependent oxidoreductase [Leptospirales bacterium]|jgi:hypothetical protein
MNYLIVGASSEAGQSALDALREHRPKARIIATTSREADIPGADRTVHGVDLAGAGAVETITNAVAEKIDVMFYTPAFGPVGFPISESGGSDIQKALDFSFHPLVQLTERLGVKTTVAYSSFYWLPHISIAYGAMGAAKYAVEKLALDHPERYRVIRSGTFLSKSTRGISLMIQRAVKSTEDGNLLDLVKRWKASGMKFQEYFFHYAHSVEREEFAARFGDLPHRLTTREDLRRQALEILRGDDGPIRNVIGDWTWTDREMPPLPAADRAAIVAHV